MTDCRTTSFRQFSLVLAAGLLLLHEPVRAETITTHPYPGVTRTYVDDTITVHDPVSFVASGTRSQYVHINIIEIDLGTPGLSFLATPYSTQAAALGAFAYKGDTYRLTTRREPTLQFLDEHAGEGARIAINTSFFEPWPAPPAESPGSAYSSLVGLAASSATRNGAGAARGQPHAFSPFCDRPPKSYAIRPNAPGLNIDENNHATIVHRAAGERTGYATREGVSLYNTISGCAQVIQYGGNRVPDVAAEPGASRDWYENPASYKRPRPIAGLSRDNKTLILFTVDAGDGNHDNGLTVYEAADLLLNRYRVWNAIQLDGGGSTTLAMVDPATGVAGLLNTPSERPPRSVGASLLVRLTDSFCRSPLLAKPQASNGASDKNILKDVLTMVPDATVVRSRCDDGGRRVVKRSHPLQRVGFACRHVFWKGAAIFHPSTWRPPARSPRPKSGSPSRSDAAGPA